MWAFCPLCPPPARTPVLPRYPTPCGPPSRLSASPGHLTCPVQPLPCAGGPVPCSAATLCTLAAPRLPVGWVGTQRPDNPGRPFLARRAYPDVALWCAGCQGALGGACGRSKRPFAGRCARFSPPACLGAVWCVDGAPGTARRPAPPPAFRYWAAGRVVGRCRCTYGVLAVIPVCLSAAPAHTRPSHYVPGLPVWRPCARPAPPPRPPWPGPMDMPGRGCVVCWVSRGPGRGFRSLQAAFRRPLGSLFTPSLSRCCMVC